MMQCCRKVASERKVAGFIRSLVNSRGLQLECARVLHKALFASVLFYGSETIVWKEKESLQMDNLVEFTLTGKNCRYVFM